MEQKGMVLSFPPSALALFTLVALRLNLALGCTVVAVGKDASSTGSPMVAHTQDTGDATDIRFIRVPHRKWPEGSRRALYSWVDGYPRVVSSALSPEYAPVGSQEENTPLGSIPQVPETFAYWDMDSGIQNEKGLSIGESTCTARTAGFPVGQPGGYNRISIDDLSKIALERCATARCAVTTMGPIAVEQGFFSVDSGTIDQPDFSDSAEALAIADSDELWIFNVITGRNNASAIWAAQRVPPGHVTVISNALTIRKMQLNDPDNFLYSPGVTELAEEMGWWRPADDAPGMFDFVGAYGWTPPIPNLFNTLTFYSGRRMWRVFSLLSPEEGKKLDPNAGNMPKTAIPYPASVPASPRSVTPQQVMEVLRDHYEGTPYDLTQGMAAGPFGSPNRGPATTRGMTGQWERAISIHRTAYSYVLEANPEGTSVTWLGYDAPHGTSYLPFFGAAAHAAPESFRSHEAGMSKFSTQVAWWAFNLVNQYTDLNFVLINKDVREKSSKIEAEGLKMVASCKAEASRAQFDDKAAVLATCSNRFAEEKVQEWWAYAFSLFAKYGRYVITSNETDPAGTAPQRYPDWWLQSPEVGFTGPWTSPQGPFTGIKLTAEMLPKCLALGVAQEMDSRELSSTHILAMIMFPMAIMIAIAYHLGVKHERSKHILKDTMYVWQA